jgi:hypothetical protein
MGRSQPPLSTWLRAAYLVASQTPGMSAVQFQRQLGLSRDETAFRSSTNRVRGSLAASPLTPPGIPVTYRGGFRHGSTQHSGPPNPAGRDGRTMRSAWPVRPVRCKQAATSLCPTSPVVVLASRERRSSSYGTSENAVKTQIWIAMSVYVLAATVRKRLRRSHLHIHACHFDLSIRKTAYPDWTFAAKVRFRYCHKKINN